MNEMTLLIAAFGATLSAAQHIDPKVKIASPRDQ
jgi:hypothetical protein